MATTLTNEQEAIIQATEGYIRCRAVPGSGKTTCITHRMAYLITELYIEPAAIVALTFTNKAAASMTNRLKKMIGDEATCFTGTFHGFCNKILKEEIYRLSYPKEFTILDKKDQIALIKEVADELQLSLKDFTAKDYLEEIEKRKLSESYVIYMLGSDTSLLQSRIQAAATQQDMVFYQYLMKQRDNYVLDFSDMIEFTLYILNTYPDALEKWQDNCMYLLCDEYQDVNEGQEALLSLLSGKYQNLTVVGDDDQCIYGWRGSEIDYIVDFDKRYPGARDFYISENFRSTPEIIKVANSLIQVNQHRLAKQMFTNNPSGELPVYYNARTEQEEAEWIADTIAMAVRERTSYSNHVVLIRASSQSRALEEAFVQKKIPYKMLNGAEFYNAEEIKTVMSYLRMVYAMNDLDFVYSIQRPRRGYGKQSLERLKRYAAEQQLSLIEALGEQIRSGKENRTSIIEYYENMKKLHESYEEYSSKDLVKMVLDLGYRKELEEHIDQRRLDNVSELIHTITALEEENQDAIPLQDLLAHFAMFSGQDDDTEKDVVRIMTIHTAKGLEFDTVFVNGLVEGQFPSRRLNNQDEMEEERRLLYVAITRAKRKLYLSGYQMKVAGYGARQSSFLSDIDVALLNCILGSKIGASCGSTSLRPKAEFQVGDRVEHPVFGQGTVLLVDVSKQIYEIQFDKISFSRRIQFRAELSKLV